jgi:RNA polymerase sigma factor (sigma-70 family)
MEHERFATLVTPHTSAMARVAAALVGVADAEDAAQEALLRAWQHWPTLREAEAVHTWLLRITVNVCRNWQAGRFGTTRRRNESLDHVAFPLPAPAHEPHSAEARDLRQAVALLPDDLRRIVALRFYAGMDSTQIGAILETPPATVRTRLRRALELLREALADDEAHADASANTTNTTPHGGGISHG